MGCTESNPKGAKTIRMTFQKRLHYDPRESFLIEDVKYFALLLIITDYSQQKGYEDLKTPKKNLDTVREVFLKGSNFKDPVILENPGRDEIIEQFNHFAAAAEERAN